MLKMEYVRYMCIDPLIPPTTVSQNDICENRRVFLSITTIIICTSTIITHKIWAAEFSAAQILLNCITQGNTALGDGAVYIGCKIGMHRKTASLMQV